MLEINLLPQSEKERILSKKISSFFNSIIIPILILMFLIAGLLGYLYWNFYQNNRKLETQITAQEKEKEKYSSTLAQITQYNQVIELVKKLNNYKTDWPKILSELASLTPEKVQITKFDFGFATASSKKAAQISGISSSYQALTLFKEKLDNSSEFKNTTLSTATADDTGKINFEMSVELKNLKITIQPNQQSSGKEKEGE